MKLGFTGTQQGMTDAQKKEFEAWFRENGATEFHHGACVGADEDAVRIVVKVNNETGRRVKIVAHPSTVAHKVSSYAVEMSWLVKPARPPLERNCDIVDAVERLAATPEQAEEVKRSGTWATVRYARRENKFVVTFWPDGSTTEETPE